MKHPKRFCTECNRTEYLTIRGGEIPTYHCRRCGAAVCRVGDGDSTRQPRTVKGLDVRSIPEDVLDGANILDVALQNPDVLSDVHAMWGRHDPANEYERAVRAAELRAIVGSLTARQREILAAMQQYGSQIIVAHKLGLTQQRVSAVLREIQKKFQ